LELEHTPTLGRCDWITEIDSIDDAKEPQAKGAARERTQHVAEKHNSLCRIQFGRGDFFLSAARGDRRAAGSAQIAHPLDVAPRAPDPPSARDLDHGHGRGAGLTALAPANGYQSIHSERNASGQ
jgi:hypothetical protein